MITPITVSFLGSDLTVLRDDDRGDLVPLRPLVNGIGVDWTAQYRRVQRHPVLSRALVITATTESPAGEKDGLCLPLNLIPGFLFGVTAERIADEDVKARVIAFQTECFDVLARACLRREQHDAHAPEPEPTKRVSTPLALRMVARAQAAFDAQAAREVWFATGLLVTPSMRRPPAQGSLFTYEAERTGGRP